MTASDKIFTISGLVRTPQTNTLRVRSGTTCVFREFNIFVPEGGVSAVTIDSGVRLITGSIYLRNAFYGGVSIGAPARTSNLSVIVDGFGRSPAITLLPGNHNDSIYNLIAAIPATTVPDDYLVMNGLVSASVKLHVTPNPSVSTSKIVLGNSRACMKFSRNILNEDIEITSDGATRDLEFFGRSAVDAATVENYSYPIVGMRAWLFSTKGGMAVYTGIGASGWQIPQYEAL